MKKNPIIQITFCLILLSGVKGFAQMDTVFYDNFDDNRNEWLVTNSEYSYSDFADGSFTMQRKVKGNSLRDQYVFFDREADFSIEAKIKVEDSGEYGLLWGSEDEDNNFNFMIQKKKFEIFKYIDEEYILTKDFTVSDAIQAESNTLKIVREKDRVSYFINNTKVFEEPYQKMQGRNFGFTLWNQTKVKADYILIMGRKMPINLIPGLVYNSEPENLGESVNSRYDELLPVISPDGNTLYICRSESPDNTGGIEDYSDVFYSKRWKDGWTPAINIKSPLNDADPNAVCSVSPDGNFLIMMNSYDDKNTGVSCSIKIADGWSMPVSLMIQDFYNKADDQEYFLANDTRVLLMTVERDDSYGKKDIYASFYQDNLSYSVPLNLGPIVNTDETEMSPFLASDGVTLYYSSDGLPGYGSNDIYVTRRLDDTWTNWSTPQNIGKPVNTKGWDAYYTIPASGEYAYFVSYENSLGEADIFRIKLPEKAKPRPVVLISGRVLNAKTNQPAESSIHYEFLPEGIEAGAARTDPASGEYKIVLAYGRNYGFSANATGYIPVSDNMDLTDIAEYKEINRDLYLVPIEVGEVVRLNNIFFDFGKSSLRAESYPELNRVVKLLNENQNMQIEIAGHTDNVGADDVNLKLSADRAKAVKGYIVSKGISDTRIVSKGYGKTKPLAGNETEEGKQLNRRVEFTILNI